MLRPQTERHRGTNRPVRRRQAAFDLPAGDLDQAPSPQRAFSRFILGEPMKPATKVFEGFS